jgi:phosphatidylserine/phosphatidylglycerophosphate/cardiolipin synthase-like enzyme
MAHLKSRLALVAAVLTPAVCSAGALARDHAGDYLRKVSDAVAVRMNEAPPVRVQHNGVIEAAFSPDGGATGLVVKVIESARQEIRLAAFSFTDPTIAQALVAAHRRGVDVKVVLDKSQRSERYTSATFLANAGIPVRINSRYPLMHQKFLCADRQHVQQGSFNYTKGGARNAENVVVVWSNDSLARAFLAKWDTYWMESAPYDARY